MPYINNDAKERLQWDFPRNAGELNYYITMVCQEYFLKNGERYQQINDVIGALEGCKLEFYRRLVGPYEDKKISENGDVY